MQIDAKKKFVAGLSISSNIILSVLKIAAGIMSGSISIISEAVHSLSDLFASIITFFSVVQSSKPADKDHPFGHGRYEDMAGFIEGLLIILASFYIIFESSRKILLGIRIEAENHTGIFVMAIAVVMNIIVSTLLFKVSKESNSISLYADGQHLRTDVYSSLGVLVGLLLIKFTGHVMLDPIIAILIAVFIYRTGYSIAKSSIMRLLDYSIPNDDIKKIKKIVNKCSDNVKLKKNSIKARQVGPTMDIGLILQFPEDTTICDCHKICDLVENQIRAEYVNASVSIHSEPACYKKNCQKSCDKVCSRINVEN